MSVFTPPPRDLILVRAVARPSKTIGLSLRAAVVNPDGPGDQDPDSPMLDVMQVRFAPFNTWYPISDWWEGDFVERIQKGAFAKTLQENPTPKVMFNHGGDPSIGEKLLGVPTSAVEEDDSPVLMVPLWDTSYNRDLHPGIEACAYGSSFMFTAVQELWNTEPEPSDYNPRALPERTITECRLFEAGPVTWPANPAATVGVMRSGTSSYYDVIERSQPAVVASLRARILAMRTGIPTQAAGSAPVGESPAEAASRTRAAHGTRVEISAADRRAALLRL